MRYKYSRSRVIVQARNRYLGNDVTLHQGPIFAQFIGPCEVQVSRGRGEFKLAQPFSPFNLLGEQS